jgi:hypothetical protein
MNTHTLSTEQEQYEVKISNRFAALEDLHNDGDMDMSRAWVSNRGNIRALATESPGYYELEQHRPWFDEECPKLLDERKEAKLQNCSAWRIQVRQMEVMWTILRREAKRTFRNNEGISEIKSQRTWNK